jgi:hypothetical protein
MAYRWQGRGRCLYLTPRPHRLRCRCLPWRVLEEAGLAVDGVEPHDEALVALVRDIRTRLLGAEVLVKLTKLDLPGADFETARALARGAAEAVARGQLGYALIAGTRRPA